MYCCTTASISRSRENPSTSGRSTSSASGQVPTMRAMWGSISHRTRALASAPPRRSRLSSISADDTLSPGRFTIGPSAKCGRRKAHRVLQVGDDDVRRGDPQPHVERHRAHRLDSCQRLADDAAHERRHGGVRGSRPHRDRGHAADDPVDEPAARVLGDQVFGESLSPRHTTTAAAAPCPRARPSATARRTPRSCSRTRRVAGEPAGGTLRAGRRCLRC